MRESLPDGAERPSSAYARPLSIDDLDELLAIDVEYAAARGLEPLVSLASLHLYQRAGHAFVAHAGDETASAARRESSPATGFVLAQAIWGGDRATVSVQRIALKREADETAALALVKALTKSAYDAGVYQLEVSLPAADVAARRAFESEQFVTLPNVVLARGLVSRAGPIIRAAAEVGGSSG